MRIALALSGLVVAASTASQVARPPAPPAPPQAPPAATAPAPASGPAKSTRGADEAAILGNDAAFVKAFDAGDPAAVAATFTPDAELIDEDGNVSEGRDAIAARFAEAFEAAPGAKITLRNAPIKFLGPDTALVRGRADVIPAPGGAASSPSRYTVIFVRQDGAWLQASVRDEFDPIAPSGDHLKALEWLVGEWVSESAGAVVHTTCEWDAPKNFLLRTFTVQVAGKPALSGTQRIGWDPLTRQFKSWVFDSEGGYAEGLWSQDGPRWVIKAHGVRHDGRPASATQVLTREGADMIRWHSADRTVSGKIGGEVEEYVLVRKPPKPR